MENNTFKSVTFGGFDKQDVIRYIEQAAREASEAQEALTKENESLRNQVEELTAQLRGTVSQVEALESEGKELRTQLEAERAARQALEPVKPEMERLRGEVEKLRPDAEAYAQFRERIGAIECEARKRAADLEDATIHRLEGMIAAFREQYKTLAASFDTTAAHVTGELRKVEVNLAQLPRSMDQAGVELEKLSETLEKARESK